ncbi:hypothetical protein ABFV83_03150 [Lacrimispora sp. BS-2]|uniref:Uncharacterized protein n=1 Tax=Lacrimispora sp. BS-2 TaxID=3151850 RepID=A0AAU7PRE9_9FIRM
MCSSEYEKQLLESGFSQLYLITDKIQFNNIEIILVKGQYGTGIVGKMMGNSHGFILKNQKKGVVYITGDKVWCKCVDKAMEQYNPNYVIAFAGSAMINNKHITLDANDLNKILSKNAATKVIAIHMEAWNHCLLTRSNLKEAIDNDNLFIPDDGEVITLEDIYN